MLQFPGNSPSTSPPFLATRAISQLASSLEWRHAVMLHILVGKICISFFLFYCEGMFSLVVLLLCACFQLIFSFDMRVMQLDNLKGLAFMVWTGDIGSQPAAWSYVPVQSYSCFLCVFYRTLRVGNVSFPPLVGEMGKTFLGKMGETSKIT